MPLAWATADLATWAFALLIAAVTVAGIWAADVADEVWGTHDSGRIVIDEVAGYWVTVAVFDRGDWATLLIGFALFRAFDILKPPPIRWLDQNLPGGVGVMLDDVAAGVLGAAALGALVYVGAPVELRALW
jgi:phosphatidylglycerophosphatase A